MQEIKKIVWYIYKEYYFCRIVSLIDKIFGLFGLEADDVKISVESDVAVQVVNFTGRLDVSVSDQVWTKLSGLFDHRTMIISMAHCDYVSSAGIRVLIMLAKAAKSRNTRLILAEVCDEVREVFEMTGFINLLECVPTIAEARQLTGRRSL